MCVGRRGVEPRHPAVSARCRHRLAHALRSLNEWSRECSNLPLPGFDRPLRHQSFETIGGGAGGAGGGDRTRCFSLTRRASLPSGPRRQVGCWCVWPEGFEPSSPAWRAGILAVGRRPLVSLCAMVRWTPGRDFHPRDTDCSRAPRSSATGRWLPGRGSNPHLPGNGRTSCRSTTWHGRATDGCCGN